MKNLSILLVEDDPHLGYMLSENLREKGYETRLCTDGSEGWDVFRQNDFDLCILDVMLPKTDGFTLAEQIRSQDKNIPFIFLTAKSLESDIIKGYVTGADDYITKPFNTQVLYYKIDAICRRINPVSFEKTESDIYAVGDFTFDARSRLLRINDTETKLSTKENELLKLFARNKDRMLSRSLILNMVWNNDSYFAAKSMDVYLSKLRKILSQCKKVEIQNVHGTGFKMVVMEEAVRP